MNKFSSAIATLVCAVVMVGAVVAYHQLDVLTTNGISSPACQEWPSYCDWTAIEAQAVCLFFLLVSGVGFAFSFCELATQNLQK